LTWADVGEGLEGRVTTRWRALWSGGERPGSAVPGVAGVRGWRISWSTEVGCGLGCWLVRSLMATSSVNSHLAPGGRHEA
jgi:hypothetical protein